ncbi:MAG: hypothetical protein HYW27_03705 [Candidatus Aenigmarchaeota archaeon]|nr:hypothetical protein [Candidatus Aenigmarchaeota archaeon]
MPKGFNEKAIKGFLVFMEAVYEDLIEDIKNGMEPREAIESELREVHFFLDKGFPKKRMVELGQ